MTYVLSPAGRMRVMSCACTASLCVSQRPAPAAHVLSPAGRMRVTAARVRLLRVYCSRATMELTAT
jgi:hypothetical protein